MGNPRDYAAPGNQDPATPWPDSIVLASAIAAATTRLRIALAAVIAPLRHPLLLAKQLATLDLLSEGRLVVQPTVSWHEQEYEALGVPFRQRGSDPRRAARGDGDRLARHARGLLGQRTSASPTCTSSRSRSGPRGRACGWAASRCTPRCCAGSCATATASIPFGSPTPEELERLRAAMAAAGRDAAALEMVGGIRGTFADDTGTADLGARGRGHPGAARGGLHLDLLQALDVHRRRRAGRAALPRARRTRVVALRPQPRGCKAGAPAQSTPPPRLRPAARSGGYRSSPITTASHSSPLARRYCCARSPSTTKPHLR